MARVQLDASLPVASIRSGPVLGVEPGETVIQHGVGVVAQVSHADLLPASVIQPCAARSGRGGPGVGALAWWGTTKDHSP